MTVHNLTPNSSILENDLSEVGGTLPTLLTDGSDSTYTTGEGTFRVGLTSFTLGSSVVKWVRVNYRTRSNVAGGRLNLYLHDQNGNNLVAAWLGLVMPSTETSSSTAYVVPTSNLDSQSELDGLCLYAWVTSGTSPRVIEASVDVVVVDLPVTAVGAVSPDPYTASSNVPISWTNTLDSNGNAQTYYQLRVFDAATYGGVGFDPITSTPFWLEGPASSATSTTTGALPNGTYRAYVRVAQTVNGSRHWSAWAYDQFTVTVPDAEVSTVTMAANSANGLIQVTVARVALSEAWEYIEVQRSIDAGTTWEYVWGGAYVDATGDADEFVIDDYAVPNGQTAKYRARATRLSSGLKIVGAWVESAGTTSWSSDDVWLKDLNDPSRNQTICLRSAPSFTREARRGVFQVIGTPYPIIVSDVMSSAVTDFEAQATTIAGSATLEALAASSGVLLLQTPPTMPEGSRYIHIGGMGRSPYVSTHIRPKQWVSFRSVVEVAAPADPNAGV